MSKLYIPRESWKITGHSLLSFRRLINIYFLMFKRKYGLDLSFQPPNKSNLGIDLYMPVVEKDLNMLIHSLKSVEKYVWHPIRNIYLVAPANSQEIRILCKRNGYTFVPEEEVLPLKKSDINYNFKDYDRNGWIYKMLLNLSADTICKSRYILVLDADTIFLGPQIFIYKNRPLFNLSDEYHFPYYKINHELLGSRHRISRSFITHYMLLDAKVLKQLRNFLSAKWGEPWYQPIIDHLDRKEFSAFADYELYGDFYLSHAKKRPIFNYWSNISMNVSNLHRLDELKKQYEKDYRSLSLHVH